MPKAPQDHKPKTNGTKTTDAGRAYEVVGKRLVWHPLDENDEPGNLEDVVIPLRLKLKVLYQLSDREMTPAVMADLLESVIPEQREALGEMDINDFQAMFSTWQTEYNALNGASLGESAGSST